MSMKAVIATVVLAILLGGLLVIVNQRGGSGTAAAAPVLEFDPGAVAALRITPPDRAETVVQRTAEGGWTMPVGPTEWPLNPSGPQELIRRLSSLTPIVDPGARTPTAVAEPARPVTVAIALRDGSTRSVRVSTQPAAGIVAAQVDSGTPFLAEAALLNSITTPGPRGWRVTSALPGVGPADLASLTVTSGTSTIAFERTGNVWQVSRPVSTRADQRAVAELIQRLGRSSIERFIDEPTPAEKAGSGLDRPRMVITAERQSRADDTLRMGRPANRIRELFIGGPAGGASAGAYAAPDRSGAVLFVIPGDLPTSISTTIRTYLATTATDTSPADVAVVSISRTGASESGYRRQMGQWTSLADAQQANGAAVEGLLSFLATQPGEPDAVLPGRPEGLRSLARISLIDLDGESRDMLIAGYTADGVFAVRSGNLVLMYPGQRPPEILGIPAFADLPPADPNAPRPVTGKPAESVK